MKYFIHQHLAPILYDAERSNRKLRAIILIPKRHHCSSAASGLEEEKIK
jgi:hypothetical protein